MVSSPASVRVALSWRISPRISATGIHTGQLDDLPPTHRSITLTATAIYRFVDGRIVERWCDNSPSVLRTLKSSHAASVGSG